ncbi:transferase [Planoprotostelium fungivorum]|uniref:Transferase n=1 Tax=Planoprotostelium fungivorum TaxID=1890364 RepID=A0A2P6NZD9_9EUKA|nr:transferase [Planoprotostelium fungivorum]
MIIFRAHWLAFFFLIVQLSGLWLFCLGFFPQKAPLPGLASKETDRPAPFTPIDEWREGKFDRLVFMVVDAFRAEFLFRENSHMMKTNQLLNGGSGHGFIASAAAPTVTLPRIKALTSGSIPNFLDFLMNFKSEALEGDNWVTQLKQAGKKIEFYGDDTWLKLFPDHFIRHDGTTSFYVSDTVEVDDNVTRHLNDIFSRDDWDVSILHYLGLDHVGHTGGPYSPLMKPKQMEMDDIISRIYSEISRTDASENKRTLFVFCSDHGMNEMGNHGGSTDGESQAVLALFSPHLRWDHQSPRKVEQVDLVPTLSLLMGVAIPKNSLGKVVQPIFDVLDEASQLRGLQINCHQQMKLMKNSPSFWNLQRDIPESAVSSRLSLLMKEAEELHEKWVQHKDVETFRSSKVKYLEFLEDMQDQWKRTLSNYDLPLLYASIYLLFLSSLGFIILSFHKMLYHRIVHISVSYQQMIFLLMIGCLSYGSTSIFCHEKLATLFRISDSALCGTSRIFILLGGALYLFSLTGSSTVEEEHQTWYFLSISLLIIRSSIAMHRDPTLSTSIKILVLLVSSRGLRSWNQTGNKWLGGPDTAKWLKEPEHSWIMTSTIIVSTAAPLLYHFFSQDDVVRPGEEQRVKPHRQMFLSLCSLASFLVALYRLEMVEDQILLARCIYLLLFLMTCTILHPLSSKRSNLMSKTNIERWMTIFYLLALLLHRTHNSGLIFLMALQSLAYLRLFLRSKEPVWLRVTPLLWLGAASFFTFGNSNSVATIDIGGAYTGLYTYNEIVVGSLTAIIALTGPLWWLLVIVYVIIIDRQLITKPHSDSDLKGPKSAFTLYAVFTCTILIALASVHQYLHSSVAHRKDQR